MKTALKRIRQLAAHEIGHTLGLGHNYYDSDKGWISVMDYPHPLEKLNDGRLDRHLRRPIRSGSATGTRSRSTTATASSRRAPTRKQRSTKILDDAWAAGPALHDQPGHRLEPEGRSVVERRRSGRRALSPDEGAACGARSDRREHHPAGVADGARSKSRWSRSPCITATRWNRRRRWSPARTTSTRMTRRQPDADQRRRQSTISAKALDALARCTLKPSELDRPEDGARSHPAAPAGLRPAPRALPADDRRHVRSAEPRPPSPPT